MKPADCIRCLGAFADFINGWRTDKEWKSLIGRQAGYSIGQDQIQIRQSGTGKTGLCLTISIRMKDKLEELLFGFIIHKDTLLIIVNSEMSHHVEDNATSKL